MEEKARIVAFDGTGFHNWKFRVECILDTFDLLDCLQREVEEIEELHELQDDTAAVRAEKKKKVQERRALDKKCKSLIVQAIADNQLELIKDCATPKANLDDAEECVRASWSSGTADNSEATFDAEVFRQR